MSSKFDHTKTEVARVKQSANGQDIVLDLPAEEIGGDKLPAVTIVTVTRNRKRMAGIMLDNWSRIYYDPKKISWLIVDDSDDVRDGPVMEIKAAKDSRIQYYYLAPLTRPDGTKEGHTIGYKRNFAMSLVKTDTVAIMDDDDFLYNESILARVCCLLFYEKQCVFSAELGVYNTKHESSYILEGFADIPEGSMMFTRAFWEKNKFGEESRGEGMQMVQGQELQMIRVPWIYNIIVLQHACNATGNQRSIRFPPTRDIRQKSSLVAPLNLMKKFPESFAKALKNITAGAPQKSDEKK